MDAKGELGVQGPCRLLRKLKKAKMTSERAQMRGMQQTIQELTRALLQAAQEGGGNRSVGELHRNFRSLKPPKFSGSADPDEAEHWLKEMEMIFRVRQCAAGDKLLLATFQLEKDARAWWESVEATRANGRAEQFTILSRGTWWQSLAADSESAAWPMDAKHDLGIQGPCRQFSAELPPNDLSSGLLDDLHAKGMSGKPPPLIQLPS
ncbi:hypothetical protein Taro_008965 [Colocasia esculenta]|uniref:Retrotransposon gag domain-containing protein n=1 Tax=Colocasia esculenta TaxID=4460 RepID=A0A843U534_COLES|nr:hypothetical protein [Colocasia esculenta]